MKTQTKNLLMFVLMELLFLGFAAYTFLSARHPNYYIIFTLLIIMTIVFFLFFIKTIKWSKTNNPQLYHSKLFILNSKLSVIFATIIIIAFAGNIIIPCLISEEIAIWIPYTALILAMAGFAYFIFFGIPYSIFVRLTNKNIKYPLQQFMTAPTPRANKILHIASIVFLILIEIGLILTVLTAIKYLMHAMK